MMIIADILYAMFFVPFMITTGVFAVLFVMACVICFHALLDYIREKRR